MFCKKLDNFKNKPAGVLLTFYDHMPTLPASDDITRFDGMQQKISEQASSTENTYFALV